MNEPQHILCIETGTDTCSVALARDGRLVALRESHGERDHAVRVAVWAEEVLAEVGGNGCGGLGHAELSAVAVSKGPGSYTGLRIGISFAKGLCYGLGIPLIGVGSLESLCAVARRDHTAELFIPMIDARRMEVFAQVFNSAGKALNEPEALIIDGRNADGELSGYHYLSEGQGDVCIFGSGAEKCREALPWTRYIEVEPSARGMIPLASAAFEAGRFEDTAYFEPFYLKDFVVTTSKKKLF